MYVYIVMLRGRYNDWSSVEGVFSNEKDAKDFALRQEAEGKWDMYSAQWDIEEHMMGVRP